MKPLQRMVIAYVKKRLAEEGRPSDPDAVASAVMKTVAKELSPLSKRLWWDRVCLYNAEKLVDSLPPEKAEDPEYLSTIAKSYVDELHRNGETLREEDSH